MTDKTSQENKKELCNTVTLFLYRRGREYLVANEMRPIAPGAIVINNPLAAPAPHVSDFEEITRFVFQGHETTGPEAAIHDLFTGHALATTYLETLGLIYHVDMGRDRYNLQSLRAWMQENTRGNWILQFRVDDAFVSFDELIDAIAFKLYKEVISPFS